MTRLATTSLIAVLSLSTACAGLQPQMGVQIDPRLNVGRMGEHNDYERRTVLAARAENTSTMPDTQPRARKPVTPILFWLGIGLTVVGGVGTIGSAAAGYATQRQIQSGYRGSLPADDLHALENRGDALQKVSIAGAVVTASAAARRCARRTARARRRRGGGRSGGRPGSARG